MKEHEKWIALSQEKYLGQSEKFYNIFLAKDMSKEEMEEDRKNRHRVFDGRKKGKSHDKKRECYHEKKRQTSTLDVENGRAIEKGTQKICHKNEKLREYWHIVPPSKERLQTIKNSFKFYKNNEIKSVNRKNIIEIDMLNVQGLTQPKMIEIEQIIMKNKHKIFCAIQMHQTRDHIHFHEPVCI